MDFVNFIQEIFAPIFNFAFAILNYDGVGGIPFWRHIFTLYMVAFVITFIVRGTVSVGIGGIASGVSRGSEMVQNQRYEKQRAERSKRIGFRASDD